MCRLAHGELAWLFLEPDKGLDHCPRILLSCFRARTSAPRLWLIVCVPPISDVVRVCARLRAARHRQHHHPHDAPLRLRQLHAQLLHLLRQRQGGPIAMSILGTSPILGTSRPLEYRHMPSTKFFTSSPSPLCQQNVYTVCLNIRGHFLTLLHLSVWKAQFFRAKNGNLS